MFQHLITFHHVISWAKEHNMPEKELFRMLIEDDNLNTNINQLFTRKVPVFKLFMGEGERVHEEGQRQDPATSQV